MISQAYPGSQGTFLLRNSSLIRHVSGSSKIIKYVTVKNTGNLTFDSSMQSQSFSCDNCRLINQHTGTMLTNTMDWLVTTTDSGKLHMINYGYFVCVSQQASKTTNIHWLVQNSGEMNFVMSTSSPGYLAVHFRKIPTQLGRMRSHFASLHFHGSSASIKPNLNGSHIEVFNFPIFQYGSRVPFSRPQWQWETFVKDVFAIAESGAWSVSSHIVVAFESIFDASWETLTLSSHGSVQLQISSSCSQFHLILDLHQDPYGWVIMQGGNLNRIQVTGSNSTVGHLTISKGCQLLFSTAVTVQSRVLVLGGQLILKSATSKPLLLPEVAVMAGGLLNVSDNFVTFAGLDLIGKVEHLTKNVKIDGPFCWQGGTIRSKDARIEVFGPVRVNGSSSKTLKATNFTLKSRAHPTRSSGVLAEYFQYNVPVGRMPRISNIRQFYPSYHSYDALPKQFENVSTIPTYQRTEQTFNRKPRVNGLSPIMFRNDSSVDLSSPWTFAYNYAVRFFTYLHIVENANYTFYLEYTVGPMRLWIEDQVVFTGSYGSGRRHQMRTSPQDLLKGFHLMRVDYVQNVASWSSEGNAFRVLYESSFMAKQEIPKERLYLQPSTSSVPTPSALSRIRNLLETPNNALLSGEGRIVSQGGSSVNVESGRTLEISGDFDWLSTISTRRIPHFVNNGTVLKTGGGLASLYFTYQSDRGQVIAQSGSSVEFRSVTATSGAVLWSNPAGGRWDAATNWVPAVVPTNQSIVIIDLPGNYEIVIPSGYTALVDSMVVGGTRSSPEITVEVYSAINVRDHLAIHPDRFNFRGTLRCGRLTWSGNRIIGRSVLEGSHLVVEEKFLFSTSPVSKSIKYLESATLTNYGLLLAQLGDLYCVSCKIINHGSMTWRGNHFRSLGAQSILVNHGNFTHEAVPTVTYPTWSYVSLFNLDIVNIGTFTVTAATFSARGHSWEYSGNFQNNGTVNVYLYSVTIFGSAFPATSQMGSIRCWCAPWLNSSKPLPPSSSLVGSSSAMLTAAYEEPVYWDAYTFPCVLRFSGFNGKTIILSRLEAKGYTQVEFQNFDKSQVIVTQSLHVDSPATMLFQPAVTANKVMVKTTEPSLISSLLLNTNWLLNVSSSQEIRFKGRTVVSGNGKLAVAGSEKPVTFYNDLVLDTSSLVEVLNCSMSLTRVYVHGDIKLVRANARVVSLFWRSGTISGLDSGTIEVSKLFDIAGTGVKTLDGITITLQTEQRSTYHGVIAEYFQYRLPNSVTPQIPRSLYYGFCTSTKHRFCAPLSFDNMNTPPNSIGIESNISRQMVRVGHAPMDYSTDGKTVNGSSVTTYTFNYAVRWSSYLSIAVSGFYEFFFVSFEGAPRLWINGTLVWTGRPQYSNFKQLYEQKAGPFYLSRPYEHVRIDLTMPTSDARTSLFLVLYEGGGLKKQVIPHDKLFFRIDKGQGNVSQFASTQWNNDRRSHCSVSTSIVQMNNGATLNVTQTGIVDIRRDTLWFSTTGTTRPPVVVNAGLILKSAGIGVTIFDAILQDNGGNVSGNVIFKGTSPSETSYWANAEGGSWFNPGNWLPRRVPGPRDYVYITQLGTYKVVVGSDGADAEVRGLEVGGDNSMPNLIVDHHTRLKINGSMIQRAPNLTIRGTVEAREFVWTGTTIVGEEVKISSNKSDLVVRNHTKFFGSSSTRCMKNLKVSLSGTAVFNSSITTINCQRCQITVETGAELILAVGNFQPGGSSLKQGTFTQGLKNYGTLVIIRQGSVSYRCDLLNYGAVVTMPSVFYSYSLSLNVYSGTWINKGFIQMYDTTVTFSNAILPKAGKNGTWRFWADLVRPSDMGPIALNGRIEQWRVILSSVYNWTAYRKYGLSQQQRWWRKSLHGMSVSITSPKEMSFGTLEMEGANSVLHMYSSTTVYKRMFFNPGVTLQLSLGRQSTESHPTLKLMVGCNLTTGAFMAYSDWKVNCGPNSLWQITRQFVLGPRVVVVANLSTLIVNDSMTVDAQAALSFINSSLTVVGQTHLSGVLTLSHSLATLEHVLDWKGGTIQGTADGLLRLRKGGEMGHVDNVRLKSVQLEVQGATITQKSGVIAEYFQHRIATATTAQIWLHSFSQLSRSFESWSTQPTYTRIEQSLSWLEPAGAFPQQFKSPGVVDANSPALFTHSVAVRYSAFLYVETAGLFDFIFTSTEQQQFRFWSITSANGTKKWTYRLAGLSSNITISTWMSVGFNRIRLDRIGSRYLHHGGTYIPNYDLFVAYRGPCVPLQPLSNNLYISTTVNNTIQYASPAYTVFQNGATTCDVGKSVPELCSSSAGVSCLSQTGPKTLLAVKSPFLQSWQKWSSNLQQW